MTRRAPIDVDALLAEIGPEFDNDPGSPFGGANLANCGQCAACTATLPPLQES